MSFQIFTQSDISHSLKLVKDNENHIDVLNYFQKYFRNIPVYNIPDVCEFEAFPFLIPCCAVSSFFKLS